MNFDRRAVVPYMLALLCPTACAAGADVAIDVGHSLQAPGATSARGRSEFEFNRELALAIEADVRNAGISTRLIGAAGDQDSLGARPKKANGARFLLSVHHDSVQPQFLQPWTYEGTERLYSDRYAGYSLFISRRNAALVASLRCASRIGKQLRRAGFRPSLYHAERIRGESKPFADRTNGVHYYNNLAVLKGATSPAVLLEAGVIVNRDEELRLAEPDVRERIARSVAAGISACLQSVKRSGEPEQK